MLAICKDLKLCAIPGPVPDTVQVTKHTDRTDPGRYS
jgi:hypothetical protein